MILKFIQPFRLHFSQFIILFSTLLLSFMPPSDDWERDILRKIKTYQTIYRQEKLFVQTDRPIYVAGEDLWFSAFLLEASSHLPNRSEQVLYVELVKSSGVTVAKQIFKLNNGRAWGSLTLNDKLEGGDYHLVSYTNWMRNAGSDFYFRKAITVVNHNETESSAEGGNEPAGLVAGGLPESVDNTKAKEVQLALGFYPEGGDLIEGVLSKVAFEAFNELGQPIKVDGYVVDDLGATISTLNTIWEGKGLFVFTPEKGRTYHAEVTGMDGGKLNFPLPSVKSHGWHFSIENVWQAADLKIVVNNVSELGGDEPFFLLGLQNGKPVVAQKGVLSGGASSFAVQKSAFETGIVQFTIFDAQKRPRCERLVFINHKKTVSLKINELVMPKTPRGFVEMELEALDNEGKPVEGQFAVSVTDAQRVPDEAYGGANIEQYLWLTSNIAGQVSDLPVVFENSRKSLLTSELIMLSNGWRRYNWTNVLSDTIQVPAFLEEPGIYVQGSLLRKSNLKKAPPGLEVTMLIGGRLEVFSQKTGDEGEFTFLMRDFYDTTKAVVQTRNRMNVNSDYVIQLSSNLKSKPTDKYNAARLKQADDLALNYYTSPSVRSALSIEKGELKTQLTRALNNNFFVDTTNVSIDEVTVVADKVKSDKEKISQKYGAPDHSVGKKQLERLVAERPWQYGLMSVLTDALPGLYVDLRASNYGGPQSSISFRLARKTPHRFFIFVDGEMVGSTDDKGVLTHMARLHSIEELISMDSEIVESIDLIFPKSGKDLPSLNSHVAMTVNFNDDFTVSQADTDAAATGGETTQATAGSIAGDLMASPSGVELPPVYTSPEAILSIYTVNGGGMHARTNYKGIVNLTLQGFTKVKEFYQPNHTATTTERIIEDKRNTLAWLPNVVTDSTGKARLMFYNSDIANSFRVEVNGITKGGLPASLIHKTTSVELEKSSSANTTANRGVAENDEDGSLTPDKALTGYKVLLPNGEPAVYANVWAIGKNWGTVTNKDGVFHVDMTKVTPADRLLVSKVGCEPVEVSVNSMVNAVVRLSEVVPVKTSVSADDVVKLMFQSLNKNRHANGLFMDGAYREQVFVGADLHRVIDFAFTQKWPALFNSTASVETRLIAGRRFKTEGYEKKVGFEPQNRFNGPLPLLEPFFAKISAFDRTFIKNHQFVMEGLVKYMGRDMYLISFDQTNKTAFAFYSGQMLVDVQTHGVAWAKYRISEKGIAFVVPEIFTVPGISHTSFQYLSDEHEMHYSFDNGIWVMKFAASNVVFKQQNVVKSYCREMIWYPAAKEWDRFKGLSVKDMKVRNILVKQPGYNPAAWRQAWALPSDNSLVEQIKYLNEVTFYSEPETP